MSHRTLIQQREDKALCRYALHIAATLADASRRGDTDAIRATLGRLPDNQQPEPIEWAIERAAATFGITTAAILSPSRVREHVDARAVVCYAARLAGYSYVGIGHRLERDHSTVIHACSRVGESPRLRGIAQRIAGQLGWDREAAS